MTATVRPALPPALTDGVTLLGEVISWTCSGVAVTHAALLAALNDAGLDENVARELAPRHAFTRACRKLSDQRIIRQVGEDDATLRFQFTAEHRDGDKFEYQLETMLTLDKRTGQVTGDLPGLATLAQEHLDRAIDARTGSDVTRVIQKLFDRHADLFPIRPQGGCYFCAIRHSEFVDRVQAFLGRLNGQVLRFPVPAGTGEGDRSVKEAVAAGLAALVAEHRAAVAAFGDDTRPETVARAATRIWMTRFKIESYAALLADQKERLDRALQEASRQLRESVARLGEPAPA
jgi:hypothetical protein